MLLFGFQSFLEYMLFLIIQRSREFGFLPDPEVFQDGVPLDFLFFHQVFIEGPEGTLAGWLAVVAGSAGLAVLRWRVWFSFGVRITSYSKLVVTGLKAPITTVFCRRLHVVDVDSYPYSNPRRCSSSMRSFRFSASSFAIRLYFASIITSFERDILSYLARLFISLSTSHALGSSILARISLSSYKKLLEMPLCQ